MKILKNKKAAWYLGAESFKNLLIPITILAIVVAVFGMSATWALMTERKVIIYIIAGIIGLKLLQVLGFKK